MEKELAVLKAQVGFISTKLDEMGKDVKTLLQNQQCSVHQERMLQITKQQAEIAAEFAATKEEVDAAKRQGLSAAVKLLLWIVGTAVTTGIAIAGWFILTIVPHFAVKGGM